MPRKNIELTLEIEIKIVSCPGVWICPKGRVSLSVETLGSMFQTACLPPVFPLNFNEIFCFQKVFQSVYHLSMLQSILDNELLYCELTQWPTGSPFKQGKVLAKYVGVLGDLLYPNELCRNNVVELLMKSSPIFPGILSPKIEMATKTKIDELLSEATSRNKSPYRNVKHIIANADKVELKRQVSVCHTPNDQQSKGDICRYDINNSNETSLKKHDLKLCGICDKYKKVFEGIPISNFYTYLHSS